MSFTETYFAWKIGEGVGNVTAKVLVTILAIAALPAILTLWLLYILVRAVAKVVRRRLQARAPIAQETKAVARDAELHRRAYEVSQYLKPSNAAPPPDGL